jgi:hypothetical protein
MNSISSGTSTCSSGFPNYGFSFLRVWKPAGRKCYGGDAWFRLTGLKFYGREAKFTELAPGSQVAKTNTNSCCNSESVCGPFAQEQVCCSNKAGHSSVQARFGCPEKDPSLPLCEAGPPCWIFDCDDGPDGIDMYKVCSDCGKCRNR